MSATDWDKKALGPVGNSARNPLQAPVLFWEPVPKSSQATTRSPRPIRVILLNIK